MKIFWNEKIRIFSFYESEDLADDGVIDYSKQLSESGEIWKFYYISARTGYFELPILEILHSWSHCQYHS